MRVLVTGSTGLVGRACAADLAEHGFEVVGVARRPPSSPPGYPFAAIDLAAPDAARRLADELPACQAIVHCAASLARDDSDPTIALTNCLGTQQVLATARRWDARGLVFMSSVGVVGAPRSLPVTEGHEPRPATAYHASKLFGEELVRLAAEAGIAAASLRLAAPLGPGMPAERVVPTFLRRALAGEPLIVAGRGARRQTYVDVADVARATRSALGRAAIGTFNIAGEEAVSNRELAELSVACAGSRSKIVFSGVDPAESERWEISIERARRHLSYRPRLTLADSLDALVRELSGARASRAAR